ncbi:MAG: molybdopterin-dependent oxidoreductase [Sutterella wadsworthensis]
MKADGWTAHPVACCMCGARCGLLAMRREGEAASRTTVRIMPNPDHPQRGYCGRGAQTLWAWNHPMRIRKPLKRKGERGSGEFEEISWDQALTEIAAKLKTIVERDGERAVMLTSHSFTGSRNGLRTRSARPTSSIIPRPATRPARLARRMVFGSNTAGVAMLSTPTTRTSTTSFSSDARSTAPPAPSPRRPKHASAAPASSSSTRARPKAHLPNPNGCLSSPAPTPPSSHRRHPRRP